MLYSCYDKVAGTYAAPYVADREEVARRSFIDALRKHPFRSDMQLYCLGQFDQNTGVIVVPDKPVFIMDYPVEVEDNGKE